MSQPLRALVTGGGGFLGSRIASMLLEAGYSVSSFSRRSYPALAARNITCHVGNIADAGSVRTALADTDIVFHAAAKVGMWGDRHEYYVANVVGTRNVIDACRQNGVRKLVYTSTPSVIFDGRHIRNAGEGAVSSIKHLTHYGSTKAEAERLVLGANGPDLSTVALRPHAIWGPGDNQIFPRLVEQHRAKRLRLVGRGENLVDTTFVDNAARAHLNAAERLEPNGPAAGKAYFISQGDPRPVRSILNDLLRAAGLPPVEKSIPFHVAYAGAWLFEKSYRLLGVAAEPPITRFSVLHMGKDHYFDISAARRDLGYNPAIGIEEGMERLRAHYQKSVAQVSRAIEG
jgi:nucleoside-diphosphate-sugar epimerase